MLSSANTCGKSTKVTDFMVFPMKVTDFHKHSTSNIVRKFRKTCYAIYARVKLHKQMIMAIYNTLLTHGKKKKKKSAKDASVHGPKNHNKTKTENSTVYTLYYTHTMQADDVIQTTNTRNASKKIYIPERNIKDLCVKKKEHQL